MENKTGYLEEKPGHKSNARLLAFLIVCAALLFSEQVLIFSYLSDGTGILAGSAAASTIFLTIATPALVFMFNYKKQELNKPEKKDE